MHSLDWFPRPGSPVDPNIGPQNPFSPTSTPAPRRRQAVGAVATAAADAGQRAEAAGRRRAGAAAHGRPPVLAGPALHHAAAAGRSPDPVRQETNSHVEHDARCLMCIILYSACLCHTFRVQLIELQCCPWTPTMRGVFTLSSPIAGRLVCERGRVLRPRAAGHDGACSHCSRVMSSMGSRHA